MKDVHVTLGLCVKGLSNMTILTEPEEACWTYTRNICFSRLRSDDIGSPRSHIWSLALMTLFWDQVTVHCYQEELDHI